MRLLFDAILAMRIVLFALAAPWLLRLPLRRLQACIEPSRPARSLHREQVSRVIRLTEVVCRLARPYLARPCQLRGLILYYFLRRAGVEVALVFGIGRMGGIYTGHCWLVKDREPYLEPVDPRNHFTPMVGFNDELAAQPPGSAGHGIGA